MDSFTQKQYDEIYDTIINSESLALIKNKLIQYYTKLYEKTEKPLTQEVINKFTNKIETVICKLKFVIIPTNITKFNVNTLLHDKNLTDEEKSLIAKEIITTLNDARSIKVFKREHISLFGYDYDEVYTLVNGVATPGEKYEEFLSLMNSVIHKKETGTDPTVIISNKSGVDYYYASKYSDSMSGSGGLCNQRNDNEIDVVLNACESLTIASIVHEILHAVSYNKYDQGYDCGFNIEKERANSGYRKYQILNEIINEFLTQKVMELFTDEELNSIKLTNNHTNSYARIYPFIQPFLEKFEIKIVNALLSKNPINFKSVIGDVEFDALADMLDKVYKQSTTSSYNAIDMFDNIEKSIKYVNPSMLNNQPLTTEFIIKNIATLREMFKDDYFVGPFIENIIKLQTGSAKITERNSGVTV